MFQALVGKRDRCDAGSDRHVTGQTLSELGALLRQHHIDVVSTPGALEIAAPDDSGFPISVVITDRTTADVWFGGLHVEIDDATRLFEVVCGCTSGDLRLKVECVGGDAVNWALEKTTPEAGGGRRVFYENGYLKLSALLWRLRKTTHYRVNRLLPTQGRHWSAMACVGVAAMILLGSAAGIAPARADYGSTANTRELDQAARLADDHMRRGIALGRAQKHDQAVAAFREATRLAPQSNDAWLNLGVAHARSQQDDLAVAAYDRALAITKDAKTYSHRGFARWRLKSYDSALIDFETALMIDPHLVTASAGKALALLALDRPADALRSCDDAVAGGMRDPKIYLARATAHRSLGQHTLAADDMRQAEALTRAAQVRSVD
jgi:tetratricopeptide (TPR) repeat protein